MRVTRNVGLLLLAIWLILSGCVSLFHLAFAGLSLILGVLMLAAGILILLGR